MPHDDGRRIIRCSCDRCGRSFDYSFERIAGLGRLLSPEESLAEIRLQNPEAARYCSDCVDKLRDIFSDMNRQRRDAGLKEKNWAEFLRER